MRNVITVASRDLYAFFVSPVAYAVGFFFLLILGSWFYFMQTGMEASLISTFEILGYLLIPVSAVITMHLFAEERKTGTIELLMTYPIMDWQVVIGKYLAGMTLYLFVLVLTLQYPIFLAIFGEPDWGMILTGYLGSLLLGSAFISMGILASALSRSSIVAAVICLLVLFGLRFMSAGSILGGTFGKVCHYLSFSGHFNNLTIGLIETRDLVYLITFVIFTLFTAIRVVEINRWK